jgi:hypothetical protein
MFATQGLIPFRIGLGGYSLPPIFGPDFANNKSSLLKFFEHELSIDLLFKGPHGYTYTIFLMGIVPTLML